MQKEVYLICLDIVIDIFLHLLERLAFCGRYVLRWVSRGEGGEK